MPLQISAFAGYQSKTPSGGKLQVVDGAPADVTTAGYTGAYAVPPGCGLIRISGSGTILWPGRANAEVFEGTEYRGVRPGDQLVVA